MLRNFEVNRRQGPASEKLLTTYFALLLVAVHTMAIIVNKNWVINI